MHTTAPALQFYGKRVGLVFEIYAYERIIKTAIAGESNILRGLIVDFCVRAIQPLLGLLSETIPDLVGVATLENRVNLFDVRHVTAHSGIPHDCLDHSSPDRLANLLTVPKILLTDFGATLNDGPKLELLIPRECVKVLRVEG